MTRIKVVHIITGLNTGGAETMLFKLLGAINLEKFDVSVVSLMDLGTFGPRIKNMGIPVYTMGFSSGITTLFGVFRLARLIRQLQPDMIQAWMYHANVLSIIATTMVSRKIPVVWNVRHSLDDFENERWTTKAAILLGKFTSGWPSVIIYNSKTSARQHEAIGFRSQGTTVLPNGFDLKKFSSSTQARQEMRYELGIPQEDFVIGMVARYHPVKDHETFLQAASILRSQRNDVHFVLLGRGVDTNNSVLMKQVRLLGLGEVIYLLGEKVNVVDYLAGFDIASLTSVSEAFPNVVGEAMACSVPCVATDVGDASIIIGDTGIIVPARDPKALAKAWNGMLQLSSDRRKALGESARRRVVERYSLESIVSSYEDLYIGLV